MILIKVILPVPDKNQLAQKIPDHSTISQHLEPRILRFVKSIKDYFLGEPINISFDEFCLDSYTSLQKKVLQAVFDIPSGETRSYGDIAKAAGNPKAARFVGSTMARNPFPILIPCHRVIRSNGDPGQFGGGSDLKKRMLQHESRFAR